MRFDKQIITIVGLLLMAGALMLANFSSPAAKADNVIKDQNYQLITCQAGALGQGLYIMDERSGYVGVFVFDPNRQIVVPRAFMNMAGLFPQR